MSARRDSRQGEIIVVDSGDGCAVTLANDPETLAAFAAVMRKLTIIASARLREQHCTN